MSEEAKPANVEEQPQPQQPPADPQPAAAQETPAPDQPQNQATTQEEPQQPAAQVQADQPAAAQEVAPEVQQDAAVEVQQTPAAQQQQQQPPNEATQQQEQQDQVQQQEQPQPMPGQYGGDMDGGAAPPEQDQQQLIQDVQQYQDQLPQEQQMDPNQQQMVMGQDGFMMNPEQAAQQQQQLQQQQEQQQQQQQQQQNYYDSIETDEFVMPNKFEVEIRLADNQVKIVTVAVEKQQRPKAYFGGYRNNNSGITYHHAFTQTDQTANYHPNKLERQVQTYQYKTKSTVMMREFGVQMEHDGLYIDQRKDKIIYPKKYFSSAMWNKKREMTTLKIQCHVRAWFARRTANGLRKKRDDRDNELLTKQADLREKEESQHKEEIERRMHPKKGKDFEILYNELEAWRLNETKKIKSSTELKDEEKKLALNLLLHKETKILQQIDRLKIQANGKNKQEKIGNFLRAMSDPKLWKRSDGRFTEVHTPFSTRAKELMDLYNGLRLPFLSTDERLDVLLHTKWTVKEFDCNLTREIVDLIDREADMLNRGRGEGSLEGLRKRLSNLFLQFIETPEFNPEAARFQKVPRELLQQTQSIIFE